MLYPPSDLFNAIILNSWSTSSISKNACSRSNTCLFLKSSFRVSLEKQPLTISSSFAYLFSILFIENFCSYSVSLFDSIVINLSIISVLLLVISNLYLVMCSVIDVTYLFKSVYVWLYFLDNYMIEKNLYNLSNH